MKIETILFFLILFVCSCNKQVSNDRILLVLNEQNSDYPEKKFQMDSITFIYSDSIYMFRYEGDYTYKSVFFEKNGNLYELRDRFSEIPNESYGVDTILTFSKRDTTFIFKSEFEFIPLVFYYTMADNKYSISKENDLFVTIKKSLVDSTYTEKFYYDENFKIKKFINTYKDNTCTYIPK